MIDLNDNKTKDFDVVPQELLELYFRLVKMQKQRVRIQAEIDNILELIRQKGY